MYIHLTEYFVKPNMYCHSTTTYNIAKIEPEFGVLGLGSTLTPVTKISLSGKLPKKGEDISWKVIWVFFFV